MFMAQFFSAEVLKKTIEALQGAVNEARFDCNSNGIEIQAMDVSHSLVAIVKLRADGFNRYRCDRDFVMFVRLNTMARILKGANNTDLLTISACDVDGDKLCFEFVSEHQEMVSEYEMHLLDLHQDVMEFPAMDFSCTISMPSIDFASIVRTLLQFEEPTVISFSEQQKGIKFSSGGSQSSIGRGNIIFNHTSLEVQEDLHLTFSTRHLSLISRGAPVSDVVEIQMKKDLPLLIEFVIAGYGYIQYFLAPMIEEL